MIFGVNAGDDGIKSRYAEGLLKYCSLDTLAMVIIWEHWRK